MFTVVTVTAAGDDSTGTAGPDCKAIKIYLQNSSKLENNDLKCFPQKAKDMKSFPKWSEKLRCLMDTYVQYKKKNMNMLLNIFMVIKLDIMRLHALQLTSHQEGLRGR